MNIQLASRLWPAMYCSWQFLNLLVSKWGWQIRLEGSAAVIRSGSVSEMTAQMSYPDAWIYSVTAKLYTETPAQTTRARDRHTRVWQLFTASTNETTEDSDETVSAWFPIPCSIPTVELVPSNPPGGLFFLLVLLSWSVLVPVAGYARNLATWFTLFGLRYFI